MAHWFKNIACTVALACAVACSPSGAKAQQTPTISGVSEGTSNWTIDKLASSISFSGSMSNDAFSGNFGKFDANIQLDVDNLDEASISVSVDMASVDANDKERNEALPGKEWFFIKSFPQAFFKSTQISKTGENKYKAVGELTMRDVTNPLTLPFMLTIDDGTANAEARISLNRADFGVGTGMWKNEDWVAHKVDVNIIISAKQK